MEYGCQNEQVSHHLLFQGILSGLSAKIRSLNTPERMTIHICNGISSTAYLNYVGKIKVRNHWVSRLCP